MEDKKFGRSLFGLFDRQRFEDNKRLNAMMRETDARCEDSELSDDLLSQISAAGELVAPDLTELYPHMFQRQADGSVKIMYSGADQGWGSNRDDKTTKLDGGDLFLRRPERPDDLPEDIL